MHGNGNDFILVDEYEDMVIPDGEKPGFAEKYCDRRFGVGADGVLFLLPSKKADMRMRLFQPDRSEAEMCGNGIRCLVRYALDEGYVGEGACSVETMAGVLNVSVRKEDRVWVKVDMGQPLFNREDIPAEGEGVFIEEELEGHRVSAVNTGVPHAVVFVSSERLDKLDIKSEAPGIRWHRVFPEGANVNFATVEDDGIRVRTYERGVEDETLSCGTGSVAAAVIAHRLGMTGSEVEVATRGGMLRIYIGDEVAYMEGPAETVFKGFLVN